MNGLDEKAVLRARVLALDAELDRVLQTITGDQLAEAVDSKSNERFAARFRSTRDRFASLIKQTLKPDLVKVESVPSPTDAWARLEKVQGRCEKVVRECAAFLQGVVARIHGLDRQGSQNGFGLCDLADRLIDDLSARAQISWWGLTIPADEEFVEEMAHVIRIRWADVSLWNLPVVAHEFGHLVASGLKSLDKMREPFREILDRHKQEEQPHLHEFFADLFALHTLGYSFAACCLLLRFNPRTAFRDGENHPSEAKRSYFLLEALTDQAREDYGNGGSPNAVNGLRAAWQGALKEAGYDAEADKVAAADARTHFEEMKAVLPHFETRLGYDGWLRTQNLVQIWREHDDPPKPGANETRADVLNAAWLSRVSPWVTNKAELKEIGRKAIQVFQQVH
ncbi:MAG: hypothetical protein P4L84_04515 [Isosphaeraceae bacterium]|nr:hypothetical protein [Isosphaeraceae bacterium]